MELSTLASIVLIASRWLWLVVVVALLSVGAYLFGRLSNFEDSAETSEQVAELRGFQERMLTVSLREAIGLMPAGATRAVVEEAELFAVNHNFVEAALQFPADADFIAAGDPLSESVRDYLVGLHKIADLSARMASGEATITDIAFSYTTISGQANASIDEALHVLSERGRDTAAELRRGAYLGLALIVVGGVASAGGFGWTSRRARGLSVDIARTRELDQMKSEFVALASHELRTPLTGIYGFSQLLCEDDVSEDDRRQWAAHITSEAERLTTIVNDLLDVSRIEAGVLELKAEPVDFAAVIGTVVHSFEGQAGTHPIEQSGDLAAWVLGDRNKLIEVLANLLDNAIKYSPGGGTVHIACRSTPELLDVSVSDQGLGIPEGELANIFERFTRVSSPDAENIRGTGLGLYLVRELVTRMGGTITVRSVPGQGSTFTFSVPLAQEPQELEAAA